VNEDGFALACSLLNKVVDLLCSLVVLVEERLVLRVLPKKRQIHNTNRLPKVANLLARTVNYVRNFVRNDEFQILCREFITDKETVLNFDGADHVLGHHHHLLLLGGRHHHLLLVLGVLLLVAARLVVRVVGRRVVRAVVKFVDLEVWVHRVRLRLVVVGLVTGDEASLLFLHHNVRAKVVRAVSGRPFREAGKARLVV